VENAKKHDRSFYCACDGSRRVERTRDGSGTGSSSFTDFSSMLPFSCLDFKTSWLHIGSMKGQNMKYIKAFRNGALAAFALAAIYAHAGAGPVQPVKPVVNINTASEAELELLPGVGPKLAGEIYAIAEAGFQLYDPEYFDAQRGWIKSPDDRCDHRCHFKSVDDLLKVKGIGPKKLEALRPYVVIDGPTTAKTKIRVPKPEKASAAPTPAQAGHDPDRRCPPDARC
jgi:competence protein ComEA